MRMGAILAWAALGVSVSCGAGVAADAAGAPVGPQAAAAQRLLADAAIPGGLAVHVGCADDAFTAALSDGGRFIVHGLTADPARQDAARRALQSRGVYGPVWVEHFSGLRLPYAENLINVMVVDAAAADAAPLADVVRVLCPRGVVYVATADAKAADALAARMRQAGMAETQTVDLGGTYVRWRKPWPAEMDEWGHPRHGPDGNATSLDRIVGPPRRVRWVSGPMHEASNAVTAGGRYFHGGLVGRDAFNGIRLWDRVIKPAPHRLGYISSFVAGSMRPVATGDRVYVMEAQELLALDARSGRTLKAYPEAAQPRELLVVGDVLVAVCGGEVRAVDAASGALLWKADCADPDAVVASDGGVFLMQRVGAERGRAILRLDIASGKPTWRQEGYDWAAGVKRLSYQGGRLVCEVSTLNNDGPGNEIRVLAAEDGRVVWQYVFVPGMTHYKQARALQTGGKVWVLNGPQWEGLDPVTGSITQSHRGGTGHCFPPVATAEFLISGEMNFTDFTAGRMDANQITKGACGRDAGFVPGNGLLYLSPKHCSCYPMLNGYVALAPAAEPPPPDGPAEPAPEAGPAAGDASASAAPAPGPADWPCYRADAWRSGATEAAVPANVQVRWTATLGDWPEGAFQADFKDDLYVRGPITQPVVAGGTVLVAQPDRHRVVALDAGTGAVRWDFIANGRVDTPPSVWRGLCLFGTRSGWVYALRMADGRPAWRLRIAPNEDRIVSFGQLESPWPVPGSVLVVGDTAYVAGGRQPLADGGLRVMALDPATGRVRWQTRIDKLPHKGFYDGTGLEFDGFDLLVAEAVKPVPAVPAGPAGAPVAAAIAAPAAPAGDGPDFITLSRWRMDPKTGEHEVAWKQGFAYYRTAGGGVMAPRGIWTYGPRMEYISSGPKPGNPDFVRITPRPLMVFRGGTLVASTDDKQRLFRRDFTPQTAAEFDDVWYNQRAVPRGAKEGDKNRAERLAHGAAWTAPAFAPGEKGQGVAALVWAGEAVFAAGKTGGLAAFAAADGRGLASHDLPPPVWDGMAAAGGLLYVSTTDGRVICLGGK